MVGRKRRRKRKKEKREIRLREREKNENSNRDYGEAMERKTRKTPELEVEDKEEGVISEGDWLRKRQRR